MDAIRAFVQTLLPFEFLQFDFMVNALLAILLLTGALVVEKIYGINGIGKLMVDAIAGEGVDYNYVLALGILYSSLYIGIMLVVDILYGALDPRIRVSAKGGANE